jgi:hypothetical protein
MGFQGFTEVRTVFVEDFGKKDYLLMSDHHARSYRILFNNNLKNTAFFDVFNSLGNPVYSSTHNGSDFIFNAAGLKEGIYYFRISGVPSKTIRGRLYIAGR